MDYYKVAGGHFLAHLYEHLVLSKLDAILLSQQELPILDYTAHGCAWGRTARVYFAPATPIPRMGFTDQDIQHAIGELECESWEKITVNDWPVLRAELLKLEREPWVAEEVFRLSPKYSKDEPDPTERLFRIDDSEKAEVSFAEQKIKYSFPDLRAELRPVMLYAFYMANRAAVAFIGRNHVFYEGETNYAEPPSETVAIVSYNFKRADMAGQELAELIRRYVEQAVTGGLASKLQNYLIKRPIDQQHFSLHELYNYTGYFVGSAGWKELASKENIIAVLHALRIEAVEEG